MGVNFGDVMYSQLETTTVGDQLEAVRGEHNHVPKEKVQVTGAEGSVDQGENVSRTSINAAYYRMRINEYLDAIGHLIGLYLQVSTDEILKKILES